MILLGRKRGRRQRTHDGEKHTPLIPASLHSAAQTDGQALHGHVLELVQAFHLLLISRCVADEIHGDLEQNGTEQGVDWAEKGGIIERHTVWPRARTLWATAVARRSGWDVDEAMMRFSCFAE
jgi:hypothetical protein